jgi:hypothetical protein
VTPTVAAYTGNNLRWTIPEHGCLSAKFTTGSKLAPMSFAAFGGDAMPLIPTAPFFLNISRNPGDFDYTNLKNDTGGASMGDGNMRLDVGGDTRVAGHSAHLETNTTYYINIRNETVLPDSYAEAAAFRGVDSCAYHLADGSRPGNCAGLFSVRYTESGPNLTSPNQCPGTLTPIANIPTYTPIREQNGTYQPI